MTWDSGTIFRHCVEIILCYRNRMFDVIIPTHNGEATLPATLTALFDACGDRADIRVTVVLNACTDDTERIVAAWTERPNFQILSEPRAGKNRALNLAFAHMSAANIVLLDDDVLVRPDFFQEAGHAAIKWRDFAIFGGPVEPAFACPPTPRMARFLNGYRRGVLFAANDIPGGRQEVSAPRLFGAMLMIRRGIVRDMAPFNAGIGPDGSAAYAMGSETEFLSRLQGEGHRALYIPELGVRHQIPAESLRWRWIFRRAEISGRGQMRRTVLKNPSVISASRPLPFYHVRTLARHMGGAAAKALAFRWSGALASAWHSIEQIGAIREYMHIRKERLSRPSRTHPE